jgi:hypothetical protein
MPKHLFAIFFSLMVAGATAQTDNKEDVLYLKNQWVIRGHILERNDTLIRIQTHDGNVFVFSGSEISRIAREPVLDLMAGGKRKFLTFTELGPLIAGKTTVNGVTTAAFSFQTALIYAVDRQLMPGAGTGADLYATQTVLPFFGTLRGDLTPQGNFILFYFADAGYGVNITQNSQDGTSFRGGLLYAGGLGIRIPFNRSAGFLLSVGYRYQKTSYENGGVVDGVEYKRVALRAGFYL